jgi:hypothetical protein
MFIPRYVLSLSSSYCIRRLEALFDQTANLITSIAVAEAIAIAVKEHTIAYLAHGQLRVSNALNKKGMFISPSEIRSVWLLYNLANFKNRLKALEEKIAAKDIILTESQVADLKKKIC